VKPIYVGAIASLLSVGRTKSPMDKATEALRSSCDAQAMQRLEKRVGKPFSRYWMGELKVGVEAANLILLDEWAERSRKNDEMARNAKDQGMVYYGGDLSFESPRL